ncbi:MAG: hypothetical protein K8R25_01360 [Methanosarcinales archaeon]|nr:hypothetical protein [Methanosarcinales archaeon]
MAGGGVLMVDILIIRNKCDTATEYTYKLGDGLKSYLESKGHTVTDLKDAQASPENVHYWLNYGSKRTLKVVIGFDHGSCSAFYGEKNNKTAAVITKTNAEELTKELHVYTLACLANGNNCVGQTAVEKGCYSWLGYTEVVYVMDFQPFRDCIRSYIEAMAEGKTMEQCEAALRKAYKDRQDLSWVFKYNLDRLLLRKRQNNMTINSHKRVTWQYNKKIDGLYVYGPEVNRSAWVHVQGMGWRKLWDSHDSQFEIMMIMATHAKAKNRNVHFYEEDGKIKQMYVW